MIGQKMIIYKFLAIIDFSKTKLCIDKHKNLIMVLKNFINKHYSVNNTKVICQLRFINLYNKFSNKAKI